MTAIDRPGPPRDFTRRPWDDVLEDFAAATGRPCWPAERCTATSVASEKRRRKP